MFLYIATAPIYHLLSIIKLGSTKEPYGRRSTYQTGCPPGLTPSHDIEYEAIWETTATSQDELFDYEEELHNQFHKYRMMRNKPGDSEWFRFQSNNLYDEIKKFLETRSWIKRQVPVNEICPVKRPSQYLRKQYYKNIHFVKQLLKKNDLLNQVQEPVISAINLFINSIERIAGYIIAPCGSGKTIMTCRGMKGVKRSIICCPSNQIQEQWYNTIVSESLYSKDDILIIGSGVNATTDIETIKEFSQKNTYCIITTYMSSNILVPLINNTELLVLDEAHHLAGIVAKEDTGEGKTRRLMAKASELCIKRLSLTYTPRFIRNDDAIETEYLTMDDDTIFGSKIAELKIRELIRKGILPDYRLWTLRDKDKKGTGVIGKAECILEAWNATEIIRGEEKYILHHLIIFASTNEESKQLETYFQKKTDTLVIRVQGSDDLEKPIQKFSSAERAIIINCKVLGEGVDIPIANSVAITYPKHSRGEITQMLLRAGRWYEGKPVFHILLPILDDEDMSGFEDVLTSLASCDELLRDEIILRSSNTKKGLDEPIETYSDTGDVVPECIMIDEYSGSDLEEIKKCFTNIRKNLFPSRESRRIQELCIEKSIDTSVEYTLLRLQIPELPEDPKLKNQSWYDYLHSTQFERMTPNDFVKNILEVNNLRIGYLYDDWRSTQSVEVQKTLPSIQHITDGYFGKEYNEFNQLREKFGKKLFGRGR
jgi:superfamily II DNA or RNA helicase